MTAADLLFVHELGDYRPEPDVLPIALTATAFVECVRQGLRPRVLDDLVDRRRLLLHSREAYLRAQLSWFDEMAAGAPVSRDVFMSALSYLKNPVDSVVAASRLLLSAVEASGARHVEYVGRTGPLEVDPWHSGHIQFWPSLGDVPLAARLLPAVCDRLGIGLLLTDDVLRGPPTPPRPGSALPHAGSNRVKRLLGPLRLAPAWNWHSSAPSSLLLWDAGLGVESVALAERRRHRRVFLLRRDRPSPCVIEASIGDRRVALTVDTTVEGAGGAHLDPGLMPVLTRVDEWAGLPGAGKVVEPRVSAFVDRICPTIAALVPQFERFLTEERVAHVLATNPFSIGEFAAVVAAGRTEVPRTLLQHGDHAYPYDHWLCTEVQNFDAFAYSDPTVPPDLTEGARDLGLPVPTFEAWAPRLEQWKLRTSVPRLVDRLRARTRRPTVCYLPTHHIGDAYLMGGAGFDDAWYVRWQIQLLGIMREHSQILFVWKSLASSTAAGVDPIRGYIAGGDYPNVRVDARPFATVAPHVDAVLTDFSSTGLYEALSIGMKCLALSFDQFEDIRPRAREALSGILCRCRDVDEAEEAVRVFVRGVVRS